MPAPERGRFFLPGPTEVHPDVAAAMLRPMMSHRGAEFRALFARLQTGLRTFFATERGVVLVPASSTALMEMAVRAAPPGAVLALINGAFSQRFADVARACGRSVNVLEVPWGHAHDLDDVQHAVAKDRYAAVCVVHSETSTGVLTDVRAVAQLAHAQGAVALVDSVSGAGGARCDTDAWEIDFVFAGSQKTLALPPGLALGVASDAIVHAARANEGRGRYLDVAEYADAIRRNETPNTPVLPLLYALDVQLERIAQEGFAARLARHAAMAAATYGWVAKSVAGGLRVGVLAPEGHRSPTVSVLTLPDEMPVGAVLRGMHARGYTIGAGYGPLKQHCVRIGHMGEHTVDTVEACLSVLGDVLRDVERDSNARP